MTVYARSDIAAVSISKAHGGCGVTHSRPVEHGAPATLWQFDTCPTCEDHLRHDPLWSTTPSEIPETPDETKAREDFDKRGAKDRDQVQLMILAKLAGVELPAALTRPLLTGESPLLTAAKLVCPDGHENAPGNDFCGKCAKPLHGTVAKAQIAPPPATGATESTPQSGLPSNSRMRGMKGPELAALAAGIGLSAEGTRADLLNRLIAANNAGRAAA